MRKLIAAAGGLALVLTVTGCSTVQPWQKGNLAKPDMSYDPDPLQTRFTDHAYHSKEGAAGGLSVGGGGCGCG